MKKTEKIEIEITFQESKYTFKAEKNPLNNNWMYTFNNWKSCFATNKREINKIVKILKTKQEVR